MTKPSSRVSAARRNAETILSQNRKRDSNLKLEQEREHEAMVSKMARLRELRLAKEAADAKEAAEAPAPRRKVRRSKQT